MLLKLVSGTELVWKNAVVNGKHKKVWDPATRKKYDLTWEENLRNIRENIQTGSHAADGETGEGG